MDTPCASTTRTKHLNTIVYSAKFASVAFVEKYVMIITSTRRLKYRKVAEERKVVMVKILNEAKAEIVAFEDKVNKQIELRNESKARMAATESRVTETVEEIIQALRDEEKTVKEKLIAIDEEQEKDHAAQLEKFQMFATELKTSVEQGEEIFQRDIATEILREENFAFAACKELVSQSQKIQVHKPLDVNYVVNTGNVTARLRELVHRLDEVVVNDHLHSVAEGKGLKEAEQGAEANFTVTTRDSEGKQFYSEQEQVIVTISSPTGEEEVQITDCKDGNYTVHCYTSQLKYVFRLEENVSRAMGQNSLTP